MGHCSDSTGRCPSGRPLFNEKYYFTPGEGISTTTASGRERQTASRSEDALRNHWRPDLLGPVVPEAARITTLARSAGSVYRRHRLASARRMSGDARGRSLANDSAEHAIATAGTSRPRIASDTRRTRTKGITFFGHSLLPTIGRYIAEAGESEEIVIAKCDPGLHRNVSATGLPARSGWMRTDRSSIATSEPERT